MINKKLNYEDSNPGEYRCKSDEHQVIKIMKKLNFHYDKKTKSWQPNKSRIENNVQSI